MYGVEVLFCALDVEVEIRLQLLDELFPIVRVLLAVFACVATADRVVIVMR